MSRVGGPWQVAWGQDHFLIYRGLMEPRLYASLGR